MILPHPAARSLSGSPGDRQGQALWGRSAEPPGALTALAPQRSSLERVGADLLPAQDYDKLYSWIGEPLNRQLIS